MKKYLLLLVSVICFTNIKAEIVGVPQYNYSIYPLEGWVLQPYDNESVLAWKSGDNTVALSVMAWDGSKFSSITQMFNILTSDFNGTGSFVKFDYLNMKCAIGEVEFSIKERSHKGWIIFIDGEKFDYYLTSFSMLESYKENYSEIQSVLDSFSVGDKGALSSGLITTFYDDSPNRNLENFSIDFFNNPLIVTSSKYDFTSSQTVIEREANIMSNYSNDPINFYNAWIRYYQMIFRDNYNRVEPLYQSLYPYFNRDKYSDYDLTELLMFWIQGFTYERRLDTASDLLSPVEAGITKVGDCDARSLLLGILLHKFGIDSILLTSEKVKHAMLAVSCEGDGTSYRYNNREFLQVELTTKALLGEISESFADPTIWTAVEMEYTNGF